MNPRLGLALSLSCVVHEFDLLKGEIYGATDALEQEASSAAMKHSLEQIQKHAAHIAALAGAEASRLADHLNRRVREVA